MTIEDTLREIKKELRANMNGVASSYMRQHGADYHVNFGIELPRLREIAAHFSPDHQLARRLWHENVRESKILAAMLMPIREFPSEECDLWLSQIPNVEIAQMTVLNLFSRLPYAGEKAFEWMAAKEETTQLCGFLLITRLHIQGAELTARDLQEFTDQAHASLSTASLPLRRAIKNALTHIIG